MSVTSRKSVQAPRMKTMPSFEEVDGEFVERTKAGTISRMRSHNGNKPQIPQTQFCNVCPAKFTRQTHLQRHMRTHAPERQYTCERCSSQFTRSDLLTRHRKTCGDTNSVQKSRRRACKACVEGKARCDLKQPCTRCSTKQWECQYEKRDSASPGAVALVKTESESHDLSLRSSLSPPVAGPSGLSPYVKIELSRSLSQFSEDPDLHLLETIDDPTSPSIYQDGSNFQDWRQSTELPPLGSSYAGSYYTESYLDDGGSVFSGDIPQGSNGGYGGLSERGAKDMQFAVNNLLSDDIMQKHYWAIAKPPSPSSPVKPSSYLISPDDVSLGMMEFPWSANPLDLQPFMAEPPPIGIDPAEIHTLLGIHGPIPEEADVEPVPHPAADATFIPPYPSELQQYMHLFYNMFLAQMPIMHIATFTIDNKPDFLISAMQACGALYARTPAAGKFIDDTLASVRDALVQEFKRNPQNSETQVHLILSVVLLQTIGLFHQTVEQRTQSHFYHQHLISMVRESGLIRKVSEWTAPSPDEILRGGEAVWQRWAFHETTKRALLLSYLHDTCHCIYFTISPTYRADEMTVPLPCEDPIWQANSYEEWRKVLSRSSRYGSEGDRLRHIGLQGALQQLTERQPEEDSEANPALRVTPFAHFVLAHAILRVFFTDCMVKGPKSGEAYVVGIMLSNWLHSWFSSPETPRTTGDQDPIFMHDALPFYWIGQVTLLAHRENLLPFKASQDEIYSRDRGTEAKYTLMKEWLRRIREHLRKGKEDSTIFWHSMMKIHLSEMDENKREEQKPTDGLLGFFPGPA